MFWTETVRKFRVFGILGLGVVLSQGCAEATRYGEAQTLDTPEAYLCFMEDGASWRSFDDDYLSQARNVPMKAPKDAKLIQQARERLKASFASAGVKKLELRFIVPSPSRPPLVHGSASLTNMAYREGPRVFAAYLREPVARALMAKGFAVEDGPSISCPVPQDLEQGTLQDYSRQYFLGSLGTLQKVERRDCDAVVLIALPEIEYLWQHKGLARPGPIACSGSGWRQDVSDLSGREVALVRAPALWDLSEGESYYRTDEIDSIAVMCCIFDLKSKTRIWAGVTRERRSYQDGRIALTERSDSMMHLTQEWHYTERPEDLCARAVQRLLADLPSSGR